MVGVGERTISVQDEGTSAGAYIAGLIDARGFIVRLIKLEDGGNEKRNVRATSPRRVALSIYLFR